MLRHIPNALTCGNLVNGCIGILYAIEGNPEFAAWCVWIACIFDFFDGFAARTLNVSSPIGKELDSLADVVSFGVLPAMVMYRMIDVISSSSLIPFLAFSIAVFSALRLAKFNIDERQKESFIGLPTPANAIFITGLPFLESSFATLISQDFLLIGITLLSSFLLVSPFELFALKFRNYSWADNRIRFTFLGVSVLLLVLWQAAALSGSILLYVTVSLLTNRLSK